MNTNRSLLLFLLISLVATARAADQPPLKVLFIGNSYTSVNDLPSMVVGLAEAAGGRKIEVDRHLVGGATFEQHVKQTKAIEKIRQKKWDVVVLQEQSVRPVAERDLMFQYARILDKEIQKQGAKTVFYLTWARQNAPEMQDGANSPRKQGQTLSIGGISGAYSAIAKELRAEVAPVGVAWKKALATDTTLVLHQADKSHPTPTGSYLAACVFYATLLGKSPIGLPGEIKKDGKLLVQIQPAQAKRLQEIAWQSVQKVKPGPGGVYSR